MKYLINYAENRYLKAQSMSTASGYVFGFDNVMQYSKGDLATTFYMDNNHILDQSRGAGYWLWKPYLILETLKNIKDGDILMYIDSGACFVSHAGTLFKMLDTQDIVLFDMPYFYNRTYIKRDCFELMGCTEEMYRIGAHWNGAFQLYRKSEESIKFVTEYLEWCKDERILTDLKSTTGPEDNSFVDHRHDQAVLSLMAIKYGIKPNIDPSQFGRHEQIINHHRTGA